MDLFINQTTNDIELDETIDFKTIEEGPEVAQQIYVMFSMEEGEFFLSFTTGIKYRDQILVRNPNLPTIEAELKKKVIETDNVNSFIENLKLDLDPLTRELDVDFVIDTTFGPVTF